MQQGALCTRMFIMAMQADVAVFTLPVETAFLIKVLADLIRLRLRHIPWVEELELSPLPQAVREVLLLQSTSWTVPG